MIKVRFAPSPTGYLHIGNFRTALVNFLFAKSKNGHFMLRIDDTDDERSSKEYEDAIKEDLTWMNINWDSVCLLYTSPSPRDGSISRMPSSA